MEIPSYEVDLKFQRIRGSEGPEHVEIPSYEVDLEDQKALNMGSPPLQVSRALRVQS